MTVRLPWIHKREGDSFHSSKIPPWKNHDAVPLWWAFRAILWFMEGSGGESQFITFSRNWFPVVMNQFQESMAVRPEYERFSSSAVSTDRCMTAFVCFTSSHIHDQERVGGPQKYLSHRQ
jgi:hypothetical protein